MTKFSGFPNFLRGRERDRCQLPVAFGDPDKQVVRATREERVEASTLLFGSFFCVLCVLLRLKPAPIAVALPASNSGAGPPWLRRSCRARRAGRPCGFSRC